ncbi:MAG TPA: hypothetical protein VGL54_00125 [Solirubrobacteraceae bacterium]
MASGASRTREVSAYPREVEPQAASLPAEAHAAQLAGVLIDPIPVNAKLPRDHERSHDAGRLLAAAIS